MKFTPKHNHIIVQLIEEEEKVSGRIVVADISKDLPKKGKVIAIGKGTATQTGDWIPIQCKIGEVVAFPSFSGIKFTEEDIEYICLKDQEVYTGIEND